MAKGKYKKWLEPENLILIQGWRRDGLSDADVAKNIGINRTTLYAWCKSYPDFYNAYKSGTEVSTYKIENAMYKAAEGYDVEEIEVSETEYPDGTKVINRRKKKRYIPPSVAAQIFIVKNRRPDKWKDSKTIENKSDGQLAALIDGLKEPVEDDIYSETESGDGSLAEE